ncbi:MAG: hypothetical protein H6Q47_111 [Deltaproteobacteria bacterium]|nr:hypothetical protein [Deltaproteobacteria bacterium]
MKLYHKVGFVNKELLEIGDTFYKHAPFLIMKSKGLKKSHVSRIAKKYLNHNAGALGGLLDKSKIKNVFFKNSGS